MGKLGKKARKFAKKNLQSVMRRKRKLKSMFKKKNAPSMFLFSFNFFRAFVAGFFRRSLVFSQFL